MRRLMLICGLALAIVPAGLAVANTRLVIGYGDQKPDFFGDARFLALGITHVRRDAPWDVIDDRAQLAELDRWLRAAKANGMSPLISFDHSFKRNRHRILPTNGQFRRAFVRLHRRYPWITDFASWNEANYCGEITCRHPDRVAAYYHIIRSACPSCHVLAAELLDINGMAAWAHKFERYAKVEPHYWGLHNYIGANRLRDGSTRALLRAVRGDIWFTETGGLVARRNGSHLDFPQSQSHAVRVTRYIFNHLARLSPRIQRVYLYEWDAQTTHDTWDSAMIGVNRKPRKAYATLAQILVRFGVKPNCAISTLPPSCASG